MWQKRDNDWVWKNDDFEVIITDLEDEHVVELYKKVFVTDAYCEGKEGIQEVLTTFRGHGVIPPPPPDEPNGIPDAHEMAALAKTCRNDRECNIVAVMQVAEPYLAQDIQKVAQQGMDRFTVVFDAEDSSMEVSSGPLVFSHDLPERDVTEREVLEALARILREKNYIVLTNVAKTLIVRMK